MTFTVTGGNFAQHIFVKCHLKINNKTPLKAKMAFDRC